MPRYYDDAAKREAKKIYKKVYNLYKDLDSVIDDEKYFGLTGFHMSGNRHVYARNWIAGDSEAQDKSLQDSRANCTSRFSGC